MSTRHGLLAPCSETCFLNMEKISLSHCNMSQLPPNIISTLPLHTQDDNYGKHLGKKIDQFATMTLILNSGFCPRDSSYLLPLWPLSFCDIQPYTWCWYTSHPSNTYKSDPRLPRSYISARWRVKFSKTTEHRLSPALINK